ncbi:MFS transporter [Streptomyces odontomachi]|uniref:MFS transporter n=1 Tax=Streptomyces odontomachi TaxID=2944940 RepID=UPI00210C1D75|nr:MFS transporter [Streptomyces sp. ODS25]
MPASSPPEAVTLGARLDRLHWSRTHQGILLALGAGWLFDSLEINLVGNVISPLSGHFHASTHQASFIYWVWLIGIMLGAAAGGRLADRFGRRRLFVHTLLWYSAFTMLTALSPSLDVVYLLRFSTALGVGAEYAIINAAIAEFMPAKVRGTASAGVMNFWSIGAIASGVIAYVMLNTLSLPTTVSWRYGFALGGVLALVVLLFRRRVPESPRWLVSQGRFEEAEKIVARLERSAGVTPEAAHAPIRAGAESGGSAVEAVVALVRRHPGRLALGCLLDLSEAFGFYGIFAVLSIVVLKRLGYSDGEIPFFFILGNVGGLIGGTAMTLGFERIGRRGTVGFYYGASAASVGVLAVATESGGKTATLLAFMLSCACATGAWTAAYPTFTELFPTHLRAAGVGISVGVGRIGAAFGTLYLPDLAERLGPTPSYLLIAAFWAVGLVAIVVWSLAGGVEGARQPLEALSTPAPRQPAPANPVPAEG